MSQEISPNNQYTFNVPTGLGLLDEDFELPEGPDSQVNNVEQVTPAIQIQRLTQPPPFLPRTLPTENDDNFLDFYSQTSPNDRTIVNVISPSPFTHLAQQVPPSSRYLYPPTYMPNHFYSPHALSDPEYFSKFMAEEDKRKRNTAASARFRIKKKMREQALEKTARDMSVKAEMLENRVKELEREIKWLKNLLIEKDSRHSNTHCSDYKEHKDHKDGDKNRKDNLDSISDQQHQK